VNDLIDALVALVEPTPAATLAIDHTCAEPIDPTGYFNQVTTDTLATLYCYPSSRDVHEPVGSPCDRELFEVTLLYVVDDEGEQQSQQRSRAVSDELDAKAHAYLGVVRDNRSTTVWSHITGAVDYDEVRRLQVRGIAVRVSGYRYIPGC
jgi:hypothetical protein